MNADCKLIWESYSCKLITEVTVSKANVQRLIAKYSIDEPAARALIDRFNKVEGALKNKDMFTYGNIDELETAIGAVTTEREKTTKGAIIVFENSQVVVLLIRTKEASIKNGRKTKWCVSVDGPDIDTAIENDSDVLSGNQFKSYSYGTKEQPSIYFVISKTNDEKFAILKNKDGSYGQIKDKDNDDATLESILSKYNLQESIFKYVPYSEQEVMRYALSSPMAAFRYARNVIEYVWPEAEPIIIKNARVAYYYADDIKGEWPEAEPTILQNPKIAALYAVRFLNGKWPKAETIARDNPEYAAEYLRNLK